MIDEPLDENVEDHIGALYQRLEVERQPFLHRARENAKLTIPAVMPPEGTTGADSLHTPAQSIGSHGVNTLSSKLVMTILPANSPMFRFAITDQAVEELAQQPAQRTEVEKKLNSIERAAQDEIEGMAVRAALVESVKHLIIAGNILLVFPKKGNLKIYPLDRYVVQRDYEGNLLRVIIKETVAVETLNRKLRLLLQAEGCLEIDEETQKVSTKEVDIYTVYERQGNRMVTRQMIKNLTLPGSTGSWPADKAPVLPVRWNYLSGAPYGRAYVDEYIGDLTAVEALTIAIRQAAAASSKINPMVNPTGLTKFKDVAEAQNLEVIMGRKDDVTMLQFEKQGDLSVAQGVLKEIEQRLTHAFMMNKSAQRQGERVTAEEVRTMISDLDDVLGGVYSLLAQELQTPFVARLLDRMVNEKKIPPITRLKTADGKSTVTPKIVTGIEALGRGHDYNRYKTAAQEIILPLAQSLQGEFDFVDFAKRALTSMSIDTDGLFLSEERKAENQAKQQGLQQQAGASEMLQSVVKGAAGPMAKVAAEQMAGGEGIDPTQIAQMMGQQ